MSVPSFAAMEKTKTDGIEEAARTAVREHIKRVGEILLSSKCMLAMQKEICQRIHLHQYLLHLASLPEPNEEYQGLVEHLVRSYAEGPMGRLDKMPTDEFEAFEALFRLMERGLQGEPPLATLNPKAFLAFQKRMIIEPQRRGPKFDPWYEEAYQRHERGETIMEIAKDLEPRAYADDPAGTYKRYERAFKRRREEQERLAAEQT